MTDAVSTFPTFLKQGWRTLWRDARAGDLTLLIVAVTLAVAALTAVGFFADRLKGGGEQPRSGMRESERAHHAARGIPPTAALPRYSGGARDPARQVAACGAARDRAGSAAAERFDVRGGEPDRVLLARGGAGGARSALGAGACCAGCG